MSASFADGPGRARTLGVALTHCQHARARDGAREDVGARYILSATMRRRLWLGLALAVVAVVAAALVALPSVVKRVAIGQIRTLTGRDVA